MRYDEFESDAEFHRLVVLALAGWDKTYGDKTIAELQSQGVLGERERLVQRLVSIEQKMIGESQEVVVDANSKKAGSDGKAKKD